MRLLVVDYVDDVGFDDGLCIYSVVVVVVRYLCMSLDLILDVVYRFLLKIFENINIRYCIHLSLINPSQLFYEIFDFYETLKCVV